MSPLQHLITNLRTSLTPVPLPRPERARPLVRMLISDTGAGHRACAEAVAAALGEAVEVDILDVLVASEGPVMSRWPAFYDWLSERPRLWEQSWHALDGRRRSRLVSLPGYAPLDRQFVRLVNADRPELVVVLHPYLTFGSRLATRATREDTALVTVVTDPVTPHASWFEPTHDQVLVATEQAAERALACGIAAERLEVVGHPVHPRVPGLAAQREALRARYGWRGPVVLVVGGGTRRLEAQVRAVQGLGAEVVVVGGRDPAAQERLAAVEGVSVLGFVDDLPERMCAADVVLSKAGPSTLAECRAVGTPVVITGHMPGQEDGNLTWAVEEGFGSVAGEPEPLRAEVAGWLADVPRRVALRSAARSASGPGAAARIAELLLAHLPLDPGAST